MQNWETLIADKIAIHRDSYRPQRIEDPGKRNQANAYKRWAPRKTLKDDVRFSESMMRSEARTRKGLPGKKSMTLHLNAKNTIAGIDAKTGKKSMHDTVNITQARKERRRTASITHSGAKRTRNMTENVSASGGEKLIQIPGP